MEDFCNVVTKKRSHPPFSDTKFDPKSRDDLVMHRARVKDISNWIDDFINLPRATFLLLTGPAGSGKLTTIRVLCAEKNINVIEWITPMDSYRLCNGVNADPTTFTNIASKFKSFLHSAGRYSSVIVEQSSGKKLIVVKDFPRSLISAPDEFRQILDYYVTHGTTLIVFICTDSTSKRSTDIAYELFPESFKQKHNIIHLTVNSVSITNMIRGLRNVLRLMNQTSHSCEELVRQIAEESHGDIRKAINGILIKIGGGSKNLQTCISKGKRKKKQDKTAGRKRSRSQNGEGDEVGLFHTVGRVLYAKREFSSGDEPMETDKLNSKSDPRGEFVHKPMDIVNQYSHYANQFISLAHGNYLDIFSSIYSISKASEYLSISDVIMSEWREKELLKTVGFSVAVLGLMESNDNPVRKWKPLKGNQWTEDLRTARSNQDKIKELFSDYHISKLDLYTDLIPAMSQLCANKNSTKSRSSSCKHGFLPHDSTAMLTVLKKMKTEILKTEAMEIEGSKFRMTGMYDDRPDTPIHISDDSD